MKCVVCDKKAKYIRKGYSLCKEHFYSLEKFEKEKSMLRNKED